MDRRLGRPLPHQLANQTRAHLPAIACKQRPSFLPPPCGGGSTFGISIPFGMLSPTGGQVAHALLTRSPLRTYRNKFSVRLACVKHAASVHPEPGSNSHVKVLIPVKIRLANFNRYYCCFGSSQNLHFAHRVQLAHACKQSWTRFYRECSECSLELQGLTKSLCS